MPIRPELRKFYGPGWFRETRPRIIERAGNCCENCRVPNHTHTLRGPEGTWLKSKPLTRSWWIYPDGRRQRMIRGPVRMVYIVLTVAHLNHTAGDDRDQNLKALCQWCHLNHDKEHHRETRAT